MNLRWIGRAFAVAALAVLAACGGGEEPSTTNGVTNVQATPQPGGVEVTWSYEGTASRFEVFREQVDGTSIRAQTLSLVATLRDGTLRRWMDDGVTAGSTYRYAVAANGGAPVVSEQSGVTPGPEPSPGSDADLRILFDSAVPGGVSIVSDPQGIDCAAPGASGCQHAFASDTTVTLTAEGDGGTTSWSGCDDATTEACTLTMSGDRTVRVAFSAEGGASLSVRVEPLRAGEVTNINDLGANPAVACREACTYGYPDDLGLTIDLQAIPLDSEDYTFVGWSGACSGGSCRVTMDRDRAVTAQFRLFAPAIGSFSASPEQIGPGESATLTWDVSGGGDLGEELFISIEPDVGAVTARAGSVQVSPSSTTTYTLRVENSEGSQTATQMVRVGGAPRIVSFEADPDTVAPNEETVLTWSLENADTEDVAVTLEPGSIDVTDRSSYTVYPDRTTAYTLEVRTAYGTADADVTVEVQAGPPPRITRFFASDDEIDDDEWTWLHWTVENADSVSIEPGFEAVEASGKRRIRPDETTTYTLTAANDSGTATDTVTVEVDD